MSGIKYGLIIFNVVLFGSLGLVKIITTYPTHERIDFAFSINGLVCATQVLSQGRDSAYAASLCSELAKNAVLAKWSIYDRVGLLDRDFIKQLNHINE